MDISRNRKSTYLILILLCFQIHSKAQEDPPCIEISVGVILDMGSWVGKTVHSWITMAVSEFYRVNSHYKTRILLHSRDTHGEPRQALSAGFCSEVFLAAFAGLDPSVVFQFIPFKPKAGVGTVKYNDLIDLVHAGEFDAAIGDITITANRSLYVDFTLPYTDLGLATLSRNADATSSLWIFMKPLSSDLSIVSACFFILLGFVIWILEHQINDEFQGPMVQQIGAAMWFAFSTLVYAHRQKLKSNLSRFVVTVWLFVVLVLVSSYTAALSSLLTVEQIQLASKGGSVGYQHDYPLHGVIVRNVNFFDTRLQSYHTIEELADALSKGSKKGGVDAVIEEIPYIKEFLAQYPFGYSVVVSEDVTNGFGFVFPKGSPLTLEISTQIARLREDGTLQNLQSKWFGQKPNPQSTPAPKIINF
ncbi:putative solute-binding protein family 3/ domain of MltF [Helianthus debilis subsp. tardiflorus]